MRGRRGAALLLLGLLALSGCSRPGEEQLVLTLPSGREERFAVEGDRLVLQREG